MRVHPHTIIIGMSDSGKSTAARRLIVEYFQPAGFPVVALDPKKDPRFRADFITADSAEFMREVNRRAGQKCCILIDESGDSVGRFAGEMKRIATMNRELGHRGVFIVQRGADLDKTIRNNCGNLFVFESAADDAATMAKQRGRPEIAAACHFQQGEYLFVPRWGKPVKGNIFAGLPRK